MLLKNDLQRSEPTSILYKIEDEGQLSPKFKSLPRFATRRIPFMFRFVSVGAKLSFVEPGRRWAHSPSPSKAPGISYQGTMKTSVRMLKTSGGL